MALRDQVLARVDEPWALVAGALLALVAMLVTMPRIILKLRGAGIVGRDANKVGRPEVAEMGGLGVFLAFNVGVFAILSLVPLPPEDERLVLVALIVGAGAAMTGVIDDLVSLRQRFKAFIPIAFAAPLSLFLTDYAIEFPLVGSVDFGLLYPLVLVPAGITSAANSFNMLEGYNGLGAGLGLIIAVALGIIVALNGETSGLVLLFPLGAALLGFLWFNKYPARVFPGDTGTLFTGAILAAAAMLGKAEFWGLILFVPHIVEFVLKARGSFMSQNFARTFAAEGNGPPKLSYEGRVESLTHVVLKRWRPTEPQLTLMFWLMQLGLAGAVVAGYLLTR